MCSKQVQFMKISTLLHSVAEKISTLLHSVVQRWWIMRFTKGKKMSHITYQLTNTWTSDITTSDRFLPEISRVGMHQIELTMYKGTEHTTIAIDCHYYNKSLKDIQIVTALDWRWYVTSNSARTASNRRAHFYLRISEALAETDCLTWVVLKCTVATAAKT